jgi:hypothetical protein
MASSWWTFSRTAYPQFLHHAGMNEVLVDPGELLAENLVQQIDDPWVAMHARRPSPALLG